MFPDQRRQKIYELLQENGSARVRDLSAAFDVTEPTIRQDLEKLENDGLIVREHGGAYIKDFAGPVETLTTSHTENLPQKRAIGELAASFVEINDSLIIDSGSTTTEFARCLAQKRGLTVVTNALNIALILGAEPSNEVMMTGGRFKAPTLSLTGETAAELFPRINADKLFLATRGFSLESGLTYPGFSDLPVKKAMIESAKTIYLLADSSKIGLTAFASLGELDKVDVLITDEGIRPEQIRELEDFGMRVVIAAL
jgi:DeoR/GlpR family transcriptional regulator of sugar metabolism